MDLVYHILDVDRFTMTLVVGAALAGSFAVGSLMGSWITTLVLFPILFSTSIASVYIVKINGILQLTGAKAADNVLAIGAGLIVGFLIFLTLMTTLTAISDALKPKKNEG